MIRKTKNGIQAEFGNGTVRVTPQPFPKMPAGEIELTQCAKHNVGDSCSSVPKKDANKIVLYFSNVQGLDVLASKLQELRQYMVENEG